MCSCCGEIRRALLDIDHVYGDGADHRRQTGDIHSWIFANPDHARSRLRVLCVVCHRNVTQRRACVEAGHAGVRTEERRPIIVTTGTGQLEMGFQSTPPQQHHGVILVQPSHVRTWPLNDIFSEFNERRRQLRQRIDDMQVLKYELERRSR